MSADWFRNTTWTEATERAFEDKLRRARRKEQYLRIQASTLARSCPDVAIKLLDRYFQLPDAFEHAQAHVDRATALLALGRIDEAIASYEAALRRETSFPNLQTQAWLDLPYIIATLGIRQHYMRALELLSGGKARLMFPLDHFRWHAARALIAADEQAATLARTHAERALEAAAHKHSGFRYHASAGLVTQHFDALVTKLEAYRGA
jgi:tetratricopeptide (TPR) repeat protein